MAEEPLHESSSAPSATLQGIFAALPVAVSWALMPGAIIQFTNQAFEKLFGYPHGFFATGEHFIETVYVHEAERALVLRHWEDFALTKGKGVTEIPDLEFEIRRADGQMRVVRHRGVILHDMKVGIAIFEDITEQKRLHILLNEQAYRDPLTGLANRRRLDERWQEELARRNRDIVFLMVDLDRFKQINDTYGHAAGDVVLNTIGGRLKDEVRGSDLVCRLGGDEFGILLPAPETLGDVDALCDRLIASLHLPITIEDGTSVQVGASIGACLYPAAAADFRELLLRADEALYQIKSRGRGRWKWYEP
ncbi:sensor domain-containing diguanylate cyclase [Acuticoccus mangrovi]|uniref:Sensor domain-containing diguanylate cyclase n=1 Tax=Acuticoccus mangrovi TaxID=2796142 RepID=A0A934MKJ0_9HYPH|nr:sensor domain-containing diguanylate cyclase [Acuticoccus mangrovi]MBJ3775514.1 sensor domain-containing diguanylate cyclase [Acuticoccus mangrovi]